MLPKTIVVLSLIHLIHGQESCLTTDQNNEKKSCVFPFILSDKTYYGCTTDSDPDGNLWCSTKTNPVTNEHVSGQGHWGYCDTSPECLNDGSQTKSNTEPEDLGTWQPDGNKEECGLKSKFSNIVGGKDALPGEFPYMALLGYKLARSSKNLYLCGGSVINKWYILTAAHCVRGRVGPPIEIVLGEYDTSTDPDCNSDGTACEAPVIRKAIDDITVHENYDPKTVLNDIALIRVSEKIPLYYYEGNSNVVPVCLPWKQTDTGRKLFAGNDLIVTGWGRTTNDNRQETNKLLQNQVSSTVLQKATIPAVGRATCDNEERFVNLNTTTHICAGGVPKVDSCKGDSGGPLVYKKGVDDPWYQVGIVSYGTKVCGIGLPGIYTRVSFYIPWIMENLKP